MVGRGVDSLLSRDRNAGLDPWIETVTWVKGRGLADWATQAPLICIFLIISYVEHLHVLIGHSYIFFGQMSVHVLCLFFYWVVHFLWLLSYKHSFYILDINYLWNIWFPDIFYPLCIPLYAFFFFKLIYFRERESKHMCVQAGEGAEEEGERESLIRLLSEHGAWNGALSLAAFKIFSPYLWI